MNPLGGFVLFILTSAGVYEPLDKFSDKGMCDRRVHQETLSRRKELKLDNDGYSIENGLPAFMCVRQKGLRK